MANKLFSDPPYECNRSHRDYDPILHKKPANKLSFTLAHRDQTSENEYHENYYEQSKTKLSHRPSTAGYPEGNPSIYNESAYEDYEKPQRPGTSFARAKKAVDVRSIVKQPEPVMKRPIPNTFQAVRELPVQSKIALEKYEQNYRAHFDKIKRNHNLNDIGLKVREMAQQKKTVNFQDIPTPIDYQEMKTPKSSKTSYDDYHFSQHIEEDETTESSNQDDVDSVYEDNDQFDNDTQSEANSCCHELPQIRESIINLEKGRDYLYDMMSSTITNLKTHGKGNVHTSKKDSSAAGDSRTNQSYGALMRSDVVIKKIEAAKLDCYKKIENNLIRLKDIDDITTKLYQNYVDDVAAGK